MTNLPNRPKQSNFETTLAQPLDSSSTTVVLTADPDYASGGETTTFTILNPKGVEHITATGWSSNTLSGVTRGVVGYTGGSSTARAHPAGTKVILGLTWQGLDDINTALDSKVDVAGDTMTGPLVDYTAASLAALQSAYPSPTNGMSAYATLEGKAYDAIGGTWTARESGGTFANASTTVAGKKEDPTDAEFFAGTDTGGTGATMSPTPSQVAQGIQDSKFVHAVDSVGTDSYEITLTPAPSAYADGQVFVFEAGTANTGACTLNVNSLGAKAIKKHNDQDTATGDIEAGQKIVVCYDSDNDYFQMLSQTAQAPVLGFSMVGGQETDIISNEATSNDDRSIVTDGTMVGIELFGNFEDASSGTKQYFRKFFVGTTFTHEYQTTEVASATSPSATNLWQDGNFGTSNSSFVCGSGGDTNTISLSIQNLSATGFDIRIGNVKAGLGGSGSFIINYTAWVSK